MPPGALEKHDLWSTLKDGRFYTIPEDELIRQVYRAFKPETERLKGAYAVERNTPPRIELNGESIPRTPSQTLFDEDFDEINRTYLGILALRWLMNGDYTRFTKGQLRKVRLTESSFNWLRDYFQENLKTPTDLLTLILSMVVNDLGKDPSLVHDHFAKGNSSLHGSNHDTILLEAARAGLVECLEYLDEPQRDKVMLGLELGSELNAGQLAQAENVPVNLSGLLIMEGQESAFHLKFMEQMLDVAGAAGHVFADGSKNLIEPVFQAFKTVLDVSLCIIRGQCSLREGYDRVLSRRASLLEHEGFKLLSVTNNKERALLRLLTMGRAATRKQAELFEEAFDELKEPFQTLLVEGLNIDAIKDTETAVIPYYMPAMIAETLRSTRGSGMEKEALTALMRYLARVLHWKPEDDEAQLPPLIEGKAATWPPRLQIHIPPAPREGRVFERNMTKARDTISSAQFRQNPSILDDLPPPEAYLLQRRRTSHAICSYV